MKSKILTLLMIAVLFCECFYIVYAASSSELKGDLDDKNSEISAKKEQIDQKERELNSALSEVQSLQSQINDYEAEISELESQISTVQTQISEKESNIAIKQKEFEETQELFEKRLVAIYQAGDTSYLELMLSSQDLSDFISKYYLVSELATCDKNLIETIRQAKATLETEKTELETSKTELETNKATKEAKQNALAVAKKEKDSKAAKLSAEDKALKAELDDLEKESKAIEAAIKEAQRREAEANKNNGGTVIPSKPSACGYIFPVAGLSRANINNMSYPSYAGHTGIDVNVNVRGKSVVAVKDGYVLISKATPGGIKNYDGNGNYVGSYSSYGEYVLIMHNDGTQTLYAHMKAGSRTVSAGASVKQGQVIGTVGNTGNVRPRPSSSNPYSGTHLHWEVRVNGRVVNPIPYLP